ncbi:riboflavin synthase subunit alpha [Undibacterium fentianense]|uniref:Riboflavin synthase n=1 Tax=Undibacterium fentianense TaxID=2828728 RepID=A0A941IDT4_9BURK|nr:riboflavin synthase subunit alpha [Undibacterium fentianense]MBR7800328.1 riboflavin synthase subunit alpha [Undibacterium fentianense]
MFTGIVQGIATVQQIEDKPGLRTLRLGFPKGFDHELSIGASVATDGVCLTVTKLFEQSAEFDIMQQTLSITTLGSYSVNSVVNVERAARDGAEIGGHPLSGHVDFVAEIAEIRQFENNYVMRFAVPTLWIRYLFAKGYVAINGASLTIAEVNQTDAWFEVWLIPETLRMTVFSTKQVGDSVNIEIERQTQVIVDSVRSMMSEMLGPLMPAIQRLIDEAKKE